MGAEHAGDEIAVVGLAGRFPGADGVPALWRNLRDEVDAVHDYTDAELRALGIGEALLADPPHVRAGGRLAGVEDFDAELFGFDEEQAARTDPQQRLFLEQSWAALEDAGYDPNLGNLDAAGGVTGLVKAVLAVRHGTIPANLHYQRPNPEIDLPATPFFVPVKTLDWPDGPRRAGVSSFGLGGTNAHVVVEQAPDPSRSGCRPGFAGERDARELGRRWALGAEIDWEGLYAGGTERRVALPAYPFQRRRCWIDPPGLPEARR